MKIFARNGDLPKEFDGDPDPRHRERLFRQGTADKPESPLVSFSDVAEAVRGQTSALEKRCIASVMAKGGDLSRAYAICRSSLQKSGSYKSGTADLTKAGARKSSSRAGRSDHKAKIGAWKKAVVAARKSK